MKLAIVDTYYGAFLRRHFAQSGAGVGSYADQLAGLLARNFGTSDFYSRHLRGLGVEAIDLIANSTELQLQWAAEAELARWRCGLPVPSQAFRLPLVGPLIAHLSLHLRILQQQITRARPDVLYVQDMHFVPPTMLRALRPHVRMIVGQIASPLPPDPFVAPYDLILTSFPHFVERLRAAGKRAEYFRIGFDPRVLDELGPVQADLPLTFVGGIGRHHRNVLPLFDLLARQTDIRFFGYGAERLDRHSPVRARHHGEVWGMDMYRTLARSQVTVNRHINVAENFANNMRLYEATGVGALLMTDQKDNLGELFKIDEEVVTYGTPAEAVDKIRHLNARPELRRSIARAGQARTLREHTYPQRMVELVAILDRHLRLA